MAELIDDGANGRLEMTEQGAVVFAEYRLDGQRLIIDHVETPEALRGAGAAGRLMAAIADKARGEHLSIVPICSYAAAWLERHPGAAG
jgi:uncharacterized protein